MTIEQAIAYVIAIETSWIPWETPCVLSATVNQNEENMIDVTTTANQWSVWQQSDGTLYGEC